MQQKDYKEIAGIMADSLIPFDKENEHNKVIHPLICSRLADYFEREQPCRKIGCTVSYGEHFNRQQFLKDCGVK